MSVYQAEPWIDAVQTSIQKQTYPADQIQVLTWDNNQGENIGFWAGFEKLLPRATGIYVVALTDVILDPYFIERAVAIMERDDRIGAIQAKILHPDGKIIDTVGFRMERSRRVTNRGHGEPDTGQYEKQEEIFAVEGAVPVFRRAALEDSRIDGWLIDPDYRVGPLGYGDDLDLTWRMRLFGWKQVYSPGVIGYHDRSTTRGTAHSMGEHLFRVAVRRQIPLSKRRLDWSNVRFTIIKNEYSINIFRDLPYIVAREVAVFGYTLLFEPAIFAEMVRFIRLLPVMLERRKKVMARAVADSALIRSLFHA